MTPSLLEHPLVQKYFWPHLYECANPKNVTKKMVEDRMAKNILDAMQQPIRKGERYLNLDPWLSNLTKMVCGDKDQTTTIEYHPLMLRLPDSFQTSEKKECVHCYCRVNRACCYCGLKKSEDAPDKAVEEFIKKNEYTVCTKEELNTLVALARRQK